MSRVELTSKDEVLLQYCQVVLVTEIIPVS